MPLYEYVCENGHKLEEVRSIFDDKEPTVCAECNKPVRQVIRSIGVTFTGAGFYRNDRNNK